VAALIAPASERKPRQPAAMTGVDFHDRAQARAQLRRPRRIVEPDPDRHALNDLDPVAGGVLRRDD